MDKEKIKIEIDCDAAGLDPFEKNLILERFEFYQRCQRSEESFYTFLDDIRVLAENCEFHGEEKELLIRDRFVCGLNDKNLQSTIITSGGNPSVDKVLELCQRFDSYGTVFLENNALKIEVLNVEARENADADSDKTGSDGEDDDDVEVNNLSSDQNDSPDEMSDDNATKSKRTKSNKSVKKKRKKMNKSKTRSRKLDPTEAKFTCTLCNRIFNDIRYFQGHLVTHSINNDVNKTSNSKELAQMDEFNFKCPICEKEYTNLRYFRGHMVEHTIKDLDYGTGGRFKCHICKKKTYDNYDKLVLHYASHVKGNKELSKVRCKICGKLSAVGSLRKHMVLHVTNVHFQISCENCDKKFTTYAQLSRHKKIHEEYQHVVCDICGKEFQRPLYLQIHKSKVHPEFDSKIQAIECFICKKRIKSLPTLKVHMYWHSLQRDHLCTQCGERFRKESLLKRHLMRADHNGETMKKFQCLNCGIRCYDKTQFEQHKLVHTKERPYICHYENCNKSYPKKMALKDHIRTHTGEKPFHCQFCEYKGSSRTLLRTHMLVHTGRHKNN